VAFARSTRSGIGRGIGRTSWPASRVVELEPTVTMGDRDEVKWLLLNAIEVLLVESRDFDMTDLRCRIPRHIGDPDCAAVRGFLFEDDCNDFLRVEVHWRRSRGLIPRVA